MNSYSFPERRITPSSSPSRLGSYIRLFIGAIFLISGIIVLYSEVTTKKTKESYGDWFDDKGNKVDPPFYGYLQAGFLIAIGILIFASIYYTWNLDS